MTRIDPFSDWPPTKQDNGKNWSKAKLTILRVLWPGEWVEGSEIFKVVQQTYYDRRIRELRESGWQIETQGTKYKLLSHDKSPGTERTYPSVQQKRDVYERDNGLCQICGVADENIQYDHKVPLLRNGETKEENLQLLCRECNVEKRGACKNCTLTPCEGCPYAYPEEYGRRLVLLLSDDIVAKLHREARSRGINDKQLVSEIIARHYDD